MGILAVDSIRSRTVAPVTVSDDLNVTGVSTVGVLTATSVVVGSAVTVNADGVITSGIVTATTFQGNVNGTTGTFSGDVSIGGTLTYEDVERVDATGLSTFREGLNVGSPTGVGGTFNPQGDISAGIGTFSGAVNSNTLDVTGESTLRNRLQIISATPDILLTKTGGGLDSRIYNDGSGNLVFGTGTDSDTPTERLRIDSSGSLLFNQAQSKILVNTSDASDSSLLNINGGGDASQNRGAGLALYGNENSGNEGKLWLLAGNSGSANGVIAMNTAGSERLRITSTGGVTLSNGELIEKCYINSTAWSTTGTVNLDNGMVQYNSANLAGTTNTLDIISSAGINTSMATGDMMSVTCITAVNASTAYVNNITIDGIAATESWVGGSAPSDGGSSGVDTYAFNIIKTGSATFVVIANQVKTS